MLDHGLSPFDAYFGHGHYRRFLRPRPCSARSDPALPVSLVFSGQHNETTYSGCVCLVLYRKTPWKLSRTRKANVRSRLKKVDAVIEAVRASGMQCKSLVRLHIRV